MNNSFTSLIGIFSGVFIRVLGAVASFLSILILTNSLSAEDNANYFLLVSWSIFISVILRMGADNLLVKTVAQSSEKSEIDLGIFLSLTLFIILSSTICLIFIHLFFSSSYFLICIIALSMAVAINIMIGCALDGLNSITLSILLTLTVPSSILLLSIYILKYTKHLSIQNVYAISIMSNVVSLAIALIVLTFIVQRRNFKILCSMISLRKLSTMSSSFFVGSIIKSLYEQIPIFTLGIYSNASEVALFGVASRLSSILGFINSITSKYIALVYAKLKIKDNDSEGISDAIKYITIFQVLSLIVFIIFSDQILNIFGSFYYGAKMTAIILIAAQILNLFFQNYISKLQVTGLQLKALWFLLFNLIVMIILIAIANTISMQNSINTSIIVFLVLILSCILILKKKVI